VATEWMEHFVFVFIYFRAGMPWVAAAPLLSKDFREELSEKKPFSKTLFYLSVLYVFNCKPASTAFTMAPAFHIR
jgi:hypothetical protein